MNGDTTSRLHACRVHRHSPRRCVRSREKMASAMAGLNHPYGSDGRVWNHGPAPFDQRLHTDWPEPTRGPYCRKPCDRCVEGGSAARISSTSSLSTARSILSSWLLIPAELGLPMRAWQRAQQPSPARSLTSSNSMVLLGAEASHSMPRSAPTGGFSQTHVPIPGAMQKPHGLEYPDRFAVGIAAEAQELDHLAFRKEASCPVRGGRSE